MSYTVRSGDTMDRIAAQHGLDVGELIRANPQVTSPRMIHPGTLLNMPGAGVYTIQPGDNLIRIARHLHTDVTTLANANGIVHRDQIRAGKKLHVPAAAKVGAPAVTALAAPPPPVVRAPPAPVAARPASGLDALVAHSKAPHRQVHDFKQKMIDEVLPGARLVKARYGIPVSVTLAQVAVESHWGLNMKGGAAVGVKAPKHPPAGMRTISFMTHEVDPQTHRLYPVKQTFVAYANYTEAVLGYAQFLKSNPRYHKAFANTGSPERFIDEIAAAGYAGTKGVYATLLKRIIRENNLKDYD